MCCAAVLKVEVLEGKRSRGSCDLVVEKDPSGNQCECVMMDCWCVCVSINEVFFTSELWGVRFQVLGEEGETVQRDHQGEDGREGVIGRVAIEILWVQERLETTVLLGRDMGSHKRHSFSHINVPTITDQ